MFDDVLESNRRYRAEFHDSGVEGKAAKRLAVLTCIDSRIDPLALLGLRPGDAKIIRNAGARVTDDALRHQLENFKLGKVSVSAIEPTLEDVFVQLTDTRGREIEAGRPRWNQGGRP